MTDHRITLSISPSILIVDDNPENLQVLGKFLQENSYKVEFAINGETALNWLKKNKFDLILLDINMPGMNGFDVCREIRSNPSMNNVPVIFLSADSERNSIIKGFEIGAQDYITKPFDSLELLVRVKTHLSLKDNIEKLEKLNKSLDEIVIERTEKIIKTNEKLESLNLKLLDLDKAKSDFLTLISHEIRTPLNGINGILELLKLPIALREVSDLIEILDTSVKRLERFSSDALLITKLKTKQKEIRNDDIHLPNMIYEVLNGEKEKLQSKNIQVKRNDEESIGFIKGEAGLIKKCIENIFDNATRFSPVGGFIEINTYVEDHTVILEIKDNGPGFSKYTITHIFELFTKGEECKDKCTGIGLPIAKMIMDAHGGAIIIVNNPDKGATVKLLFNKSHEK